MIRVSKSVDVPPSLLVANCTSYNGLDVQKALVTDHHEKCYLCEQKTGKDFQIEHLKAKAEGYSPHLEYIWSNLFLSCPYCNSRKHESYVILDPATNNIEDFISHRLDLTTKTVVIKDLREGTNDDCTAWFLGRLFNGKHNLRDTKAGILYRDLQREMVFFLGILLDYKTAATPENKQKVIDSLLITKEFLAFKYWIVKDNNLYNDFQEHMNWNRPIV